MSSVIKLRVVTPVMTRGGLRKFFAITPQSLMAECRYIDDFDVRHVIVDASIVMTACRYSTRADGSRLRVVMSAATKV